MWGRRGKLDGESDDLGFCRLHVLGAAKQGARGRPLRSVGLRASGIEIVLAVCNLLVGSCALAVASTAARADGYAAVAAGNAATNPDAGIGAARIEPARTVRVPGSTLVTVRGAARGRPIPAGFLGLSIEYDAVEGYAGEDPKAIDPVFVQLIRNLTPARAPLLRIGGDSTDWTWWPAPSVPRPPGVTYALSTGWVQVTRALAQALRAHLILGINLEADSQEVAAAEVRSLTAGLGHASIEAFELGNEPELYSSFGWYTDSNGISVPGRPPGYDFNAFMGEFSSLARAVSPAPLAGPAIGNSRWFRSLRSFLAAEPRVRLVTLHRYPLYACSAPSTSPVYSTVGKLLAPISSSGLAASVAPYVRIAHARHLALRVDEINADSCGNAPAPAHGFGSALWVLDTLFEMARVGVDGVNIHTYPGATCRLFTLERISGTWSASVAPEYYGMLMFAQAAPPGSTLLPLFLAGGNPLRAWATRGRNGVIRVVLINDGNRRRRVALALPATAATATLERLLAPSILAQQGVTLHGQSFGLQTETGLLTGSPRLASVNPSGGRYLVTLPATSAAMLTIP